MDVTKTVREFYRYFEKMDLKPLVALFASNATVNSPTLGEKDPQTFYKEIFSKSKKFKVTINDIFVNPEKPNRAAAHVNFTWETKQGDNLSFETVVIFEVNPQGKILTLNVIYDAQAARDAMRKAS